jgi:Fur family iron response transcriptional regulator
VVNGTLTDIDASTVRIEGLPKLPEDVVTEGIDVIVRVRPRAVS